MAYIQITDFNPCESGLMDELTDEELLVINGGSDKKKVPKNSGGTKGGKGKDGGILSNAARDLGDKIEAFGDALEDLVDFIF